MKHFSLCSLRDTAVLKWWVFFPLKWRAIKFSSAPATRKRRPKCLFWESQPFLNLLVTFQATPYIRKYLPWKWQMKISQWYSQHVRAEMFEILRHLRCFLLSSCCTSHSLGRRQRLKSCTLLPLTRGRSPPLANAKSLSHLESWNRFLSSAAFSLATCLHPKALHTWCSCKANRPHGSRFPLDAKRTSRTGRSPQSRDTRISWITLFAFNT